MNKAVGKVNWIGKISLCGQLNPKICLFLDFSSNRLLEINSIGIIPCEDICSGVRVSI